MIVVSVFGKASPVTIGVSRRKKRNGRRIWRFFIENFYIGDILGTIWNDLEHYPEHSLLHDVNKIALIQIQLEPLTKALFVA